MKIGKAIKIAFNKYLSNPVIILPFLIIGAITNTLNLFIKSYFERSIPSLDVMNIKSLMLFESLGRNLLEALIGYSVLLVLGGLLVLILTSFLEAYAIGLSKEMIKKKAKLSDGLSAMVHGPAIIGKTLILWILFLAGSIVVITPAVVLFGPVGVLPATVILLIYLSILLAVSFFSEQSIVIDGKGPWKGLVESYHFIKKNLEGVALLILFVAGLYLTFGIMQASASTLGSTLLNKSTQLIVGQGLHLILYSLILYPFMFVLKTFYYIKNK